jgi:hypothetical protein
MSTPESVPMLTLAWVPLFSGMTLQGGQTACPPRPVIPAQAGTHASLRLHSLASLTEPVELWVLGTSPRMTVEYAAAVANANDGGGGQ